MTEFVLTVGDRTFRYEINTDIVTRFPDVARKLVLQWASLQIEKEIPL